MLFKNLFNILNSVIHMCSQLVKLDTAVDFLLFVFMELTHPTPFGLLECQRHEQSKSTSVLNNVAPFIHTSSDLIFYDSFVFIFDEVPNIYIKLNKHRNTFLREVKK